MGSRSLGACVTYQLRDVLSYKEAIDWEAFKYKKFKIKNTTKESMALGDRMKHMQSKTQNIIRQKWQQNTKTKFFGRK